MIISHSRKFTFVHIHKTGGTSVERALDPYLAWNDIILGGSAFGEKLQQPYNMKFKLQKHSTVTEIETICGAMYVDEYYLFTLVRHPLSRACSLYNFAGNTLNKWASQQGIALKDVPSHITKDAIRKKPGLKWASSRAFMASPGFSEFIRHEKISGAPGFRTQANSLRAASTGKLKGEFYRLEDHDSWVPALRTKLGIDFELPLANASTLKMIDEQSVNDEDRRYVENLFKEDYDVFGY